MKMNINAWRDLATVLDSIPQKDLPTTKDVRKCVGIVEQIRTNDAVKKSIDEYEKLNSQLNTELEPLREQAGADQEKAKELEPQAQKIVNSYQDKFRKLDEKYKKTEAEIEIDGNYKTFVKENFVKLIKPSYNDKKALLKVADAFGIED